MLIVPVPGGRRHARERCSACAIVFLCVCVWLRERGGEGGKGGGKELIDRLCKCILFYSVLSAFQNPLLDIGLP